MTYAGVGVEGDVVVVTGGGTGIGAAIAERFATEGARVAIVGRRHAPLSEVAARTGALAVVADAGDATSMRAAREQIVSTFGRIDALVANAGGGGFTTVSETTDTDWAESLHANVTTAFVSARELLAPLREARGSIVVISSLSGLAAGPGLAGYTTAKHAVMGLVKSLARDYGTAGVRVNSVCPGWVRTPMADGEMDELVSHLGLESRAEAYDLVTGDIPLRRVAEPGDVAAAVRFLASREASYITGATLVVDGGAHIVDVPTLAFERVRT